MLVFLTPPHLLILYKGLTCPCMEYMTFHFTLNFITLVDVSCNIHLACVDAHSHVDIFIGSSVKVLDGINHGETHVDTTLGMVWLWFRATTHTVVTITQGADLLTAASLADYVKSTEQVVEESN